MRWYVHPAIMRNPIAAAATSSSCGAGAYLAAFVKVISPALHRFKPELIVIAGGLDANAYDPLGSAGGSRNDEGGDS